MMHGRSLAVAIPAVLALAVPASAGAACAQTSVEDLARTVPVVVTAKAQPGPLAPNGIGLLSPAAFHVVAYDQGSGPQDIKVQTALTNGASGLAALSEGVNPMVGQTWRLWGTLGADGVLQTSVCQGSALVVAQQTPTLTAGKRSASLRTASFAGVARGGGALQTVTVPRGTKAVLHVPARQASGGLSAAMAKSIVAVRQTRGTTTTSVAARWSASDGVLSAKLAAPKSGSATIIVITHAASYALRLRAG